MEDLIIETFGVIEEKIEVEDFIRWLPKDTSLFLVKGEDLMEFQESGKKPKLIKKFYIRVK